MHFLSVRSLASASAADALLSYSHLRRPHSQSIRLQLGQLGPHRWLPTISLRSVSAPELPPQLRSLSAARLPAPTFNVILSLLAAWCAALNIRIFDESLFVISGAHINTGFYNVDQKNSYEFYPRKEDTMRPSAYLEPFRRTCSPGARVSYYPQARGIVSNR